METLTVNSGNTEFDKAFVEFADKLVKKFMLRSDKYGDDSVTIQGNSARKNLTTGIIFDKFDEEVGEFNDERETIPIDFDRLSSESVDVATVAFLVDWFVRDGR